VLLSGCKGVCLQHLYCEHEPETHPFLQQAKEALQQALKYLMTYRHNEPERNGDLFMMRYASGEDAVKVSRASHASGEKAQERKATCFCSAPPQAVDRSAEGHPMSTESSNDQDSWHARHAVNNRQIIGGEGHNPRPAMDDL
jgi:hypothetical protein